MVAAWWRHGGVIVALWWHHGGVVVASWWRRGGVMVALGYAPKPVKTIKFFYDTGSSFG